MTRLQDANTKLEQDVDGEWTSNTSGCCRLLSFHWFLSVLTRLLAGDGLRMAHATMSVKLTKKVKELNDAKLRII